MSNHLSETMKSARSTLAAAALTLFASGCAHEGDNCVNDGFDSCNPAVTIEVDRAAHTCDKFPTHRESVDVIGTVVGSTRENYILRCFVDTRSSTMDPGWEEMDVETTGCDGTFTAHWEAKNAYDLDEPWVAVACITTPANDENDCDGYAEWVDEASADGIDECLDNNTATQFGYTVCESSDPARGDMFDAYDTYAVLLIANECENPCATEEDECNETPSDCDQQ